MTAVVDLRIWSSAAIAQFGSLKAWLFLTHAVSSTVSSSSTLFLSSASFGQHFTRHPSSIDPPSTFPTLVQEYNLKIIAPPPTIALQAFHLSKKIPSELSRPKDPNGSYYPNLYPRNLRNPNLPEAEMKWRSSATGPGEHKDRVSEPDAPGSGSLSSVK